MITTSLELTQHHYERQSISKKILLLSMLQVEGTAFAKRNSFGEDLIYLDLVKNLTPMELDMERKRLNDELKTTF